MNLHSQSLEEAFQGLKLNRKSFIKNQSYHQRLSLNQEIPSGFLKSSHFLILIFLKCKDPKELLFFSQFKSILLQKLYTLKGNKIFFLILLVSVALNFMMVQLKKYNLRARNVRRIKK